MKAVKISVLILAALIVLAAIGVYSGLYNFAADDSHWGLTTRIIETARERSIASRSDEISVPANLQDAKVIASGAGEYAEMCTGCHLAPGMKDTEMRAGLYPKPPNLVDHGAHRAAAQQFWIIKHGLKMTGMPAWGLTHDDERIWSMVAFLRKLPELTPEAYRELVESGEGGHHHDENSGGDHADVSGEKAHEHGPAEGTDKSSAAPAAHEHAPGTKAHEHKSEQSTLPPAAVNPAATVDRFQSLLAKGDTAAAAKILDSMVLIYEGGQAEKSREEYASHHLQADAKFLKGATVRVLSRTGDSKGDLAWVATESELTTSGAKAASLITTETMILKRDAQGWHIAHIHWSSRQKGP
jgi:mono/diheme cytochrome c family protein/ketosteroid isomerase-like protein